MIIKKFLAFSCTHCPLQDNEAIEWLIQQIRQHKPDVIVHLGDGHEMASCSRWPNEYDWDLELEYVEHNRILRNVRKAAPKDARLLFLPGNHDANLLAVGRLDKRYRNLLDYRDHESEFIEKNWEIPTSYEYNKQRGVFRLGQVTFAHGYEAGQNADEFHTLLLGVPYGLYVGGHTHRPMAPTRAFRTKAVPLPYWYANAGCMREMNPDWMKRKRSNLWGQAAVLGEVSILKSPRVNKNWNAETRIFRMKEEV